MNLVIKNEDRLKLNWYRVGWRHIFPNGKSHDMMWGLAKNQNQLDVIIEECKKRCEKENKNLKIIDERKN